MILALNICISQWTPALIYKLRFYTACIYIDTYINSTNILIIADGTANITSSFIKTREHYLPPNLPTGAADRPSPHSIRSTASLTPARLHLPLHVPGRSPGLLSAPCSHAAAPVPVRQPLPCAPTPAAPIAGAEVTDDDR